MGVLNGGAQELCLGSLPGPRVERQDLDPCEAAGGNSRSLPWAGVEGRWTQG